MAISRDDVRHVARLAKLELTDAEIERYQQDLGRIVAYVAELSGVDTTDVAPTAQVSVELAPLRADQATGSLAHDVALSQAPRHSEGGFAVPAFVDE